MVLSVYAPCCSGGSERAGAAAFSFLDRNQQRSSMQRHFPDILPALPQSPFKGIPISRPQYFAYLPVRARETNDGKNSIRCKTYIANGTSLKLVISRLDGCLS